MKDADIISIDEIKALLKSAEIRIQKEKDYTLIGPYVTIFLWKIVRSIANG
jgi:hypothetical protein